MIEINKACSVPIDEQIIYKAAFTALAVEKGLNQPVSNWELSIYLTDDEEMQRVIQVRKF